MDLFGIIGVGNMGEAILRGMVGKGVLPAEKIMISDPNATKCEQLKNELNVCIAPDLTTLITSSDMTLLCVKPDVCGAIIEHNRNAFAAKALVSIVTGWSAARLLDVLPGNTRVLHVMPNTPALVGEGMTVFEENDTLTPEEHAFIEEAFRSLGRVSSVPARLANAVVGVSGSGPAYVYMFIEALADGGVRSGLSRSKAYELAAETVLGSAKMVLETRQHPGRLKDAVCSPGGTTIEAVAKLEELGMRHAVMEAVKASTAKAFELEKS